MRTPEIKHKQKTVMSYPKISIVSIGVFWLKKSEAAPTANAAMKCLSGYKAHVSPAYVFCVSFLC